MEELKAQINDLRTALKEQAEINKRQQKLIIGVIAAIAVYTVAGDRVEQFNQQYGQALQVAGLIMGVGIGAKGIKDNG